MKVDLKILIVLIMLSCGKSNSDDPIPYVQVDHYINITLPQYSKLQFIGGFTKIENIGVKGIAVFKTLSGEYKSFDLNCSYHPLDACSVLTIDSTGFFMKCGQYVSGVWKECCGSQFGTDGFPSKSPAQRQLREYYTALNGNILHIYSN